MGNNDKSNEVNGTKEEYEEICIIELLKVFLGALFRCNTILALIIITAITTYLCFFGPTPKHCLYGETGDFLTMAGFCLASLAILYSYDGIKKLNKENIENLFAEFSVGVIIPLIGVVINIFTSNKGILFIRIFSYLWCIHICLHLFSLASFIKQNK